MRASKAIAILCAAIFASGCTLEVQDPYGGRARVTIGDGEGSGSTSVTPTTGYTGSTPSAETSSGLVEIGGEKIKPKLANLFAAMNRALRLKRYREGRDIAQGLARAFGAALHGLPSRESGSRQAAKPPKSDTEPRSEDAFDDMKSVIQDSK